MVCSFVCLFVTVRSYLDLCIAHNIPFLCTFTVCLCFVSCVYMRVCALCVSMSLCVCVLCVRVECAGHMRV